MHQLLLESLMVLRKVYQDMNEGKIIEYIDQGRIMCAVCLQDKGGRLHLLTPLNREVNLVPKRAIFISSSNINHLGPREGILAALRGIELSRDRLRKDINVRELWDLIRDEKETFDYDYLANLCFKGTITDDHISALVRALFNDKVYFKIKDGRFVPNSEEKVEEIIRQREEECRKEERVEKGSAWLRKVLRGEVIEDHEDHEDIIDILEDLALYGREAHSYKFGKELLSRVGAPDTSEARKLLVKLGVWEEDELVDLHRSRIRQGFNDDQLTEARELSGDIDLTAREDLRHLPAFTIDGPLTKDFDDALSVDILDDYIHVGIHITDVASLIVPDSLLDREASLRGASLYLPTRHIPMLPDNLSDDRLSLLQGSDRLAISLLARFDRAGNIQDCRFVLSIIRVRRHWTYDLFNEMYDQEDQLPGLYNLCDMLRKKRVEKGALILSLPELSIELENNSAVSIRMISQETPSRIIVAEMMILYNWLAARFCRDNNIPIIYRGQKEPSERLAIDETGYVYYVFRQRRKLFPLVIDIEPSPHAGLGLDAYSNLTSPIRRYFDLINQRQVRHYLLNGKPLHSKEEMEKIRLTVAPASKDLNTIKANRTRYWIHKYLSAHIGEKYQAIIFDVLKSNYRIILEDFLLVAEIKRQAGQDFSPGEKILVEVKKSDPWNDSLELEYVR
jgi:exoribonuclease-2